MNFILFSHVTKLLNQVRITKRDSPQILIRTKKLVFEMQKILFSMKKGKVSRSTGMLIQSSVADVG